MRELAPDVAPFLDMDMKLYVQQLRATKEITTATELVVDIASQQQSRLHFTDRRNTERFLESGRSASRPGSPRYSEAEKSIFRATRFYARMPKKTAPVKQPDWHTTVELAEVPVCPMVDLVLWGGDALMDTFDNRKGAQYIHSDRKAELLATDWLMDSPITAAELAYVYYPYWSYKDNRLLSVGDWVRILSSQELRRIAGARVEPQRYSSYSAVNGKVNSAFDRCREGGFPAGSEMAWALLVQHYIFKDKSYSALAAAHFQPLSKQYEPEEVAPYVVQGFPPDSIRKAIEFGLDLNVIESLYTEGY